MIKFSIENRERVKASYMYNEVFESDRIMPIIPAISFPSNWKIKMLPPYMGATLRFTAIDEDMNEISVYLDCFNILGSFGKNINEPEPYWEAYAYKRDSETFRCGINETDVLIEAMKAEFERMKNDKS